MARGGPRPGAGRKPGTGTSPAWRISAAFTKERERLADLLEQTGFDPAARLVELASDKSVDPKVAVLAASTLMQYTMPRPPHLEERAEVQLTNINSPEDVITAIGQLAALTAAGVLPTKQALAITKTLEAALEAYHTVDAQRELEALKKQLTRTSSPTQLPVYGGFHV